MTVTLFEHPLPPYSRKHEIALRDSAPIKAALASGAIKREYHDHRLAWLPGQGGIEVLQAGLAAGNIRFSHELK